MDVKYGDARYQSRMVESREDGFVGYRLARTRSGDVRDVAQVTFWDATGQFYIETFDEDVPLAIARELIAEAETNIIVR